MYFFLSFWASALSFILIIIWFVFSKYAFNKKIISKNPIIPSIIYDIIFLFSSPVIDPTVSDILFITNRNNITIPKIKYPISFIFLFMTLSFLVPISPTNASIVTPNISAISFKFWISGSDCPLSHFVTACLDTFNFSASCSWVNFASFLRYFKFSLNFIFYSSSFNFMFLF